MVATILISFCRKISFSSLNGVKKYSLSAAPLVMIVVVGLIGDDRDVFSEFKNTSPSAFKAELQMNPKSMLA